MKKIVLSITLVAVCALFMSFVIKPTSKNIESFEKAKTTETLYDSEYGMTLTLYSNGYCKLKRSNGPASGNYDIDPRSSKITIEWDDDDSEYGYVTWVSTTSGRRIKSATIHGVTFDNTERFVVNR